MTRIYFTSVFLKGNITHKSRNYSVKYARQRYEKFRDERERMLILTKLYDWMIWLIKSYLSSEFSIRVYFYHFISKVLVSQITSLQIYFLLFMIALRMKFYFPSCHECDIKWQFDTRITSLGSYLSYQTVVSSLRIVREKLKFLIEIEIVCSETRRILTILFLEIIVSTSFVTPNIIISIKIIFVKEYLNIATNPIKITKTLNYCNFESSHILSIKLRSLEAPILPL